MTRLFLYLVNRSITTGFLILAVMALRLLFRKLPKGPQCLLWALVGLRLALPFSLESAASLIPQAEPIPAQAVVQGAPAVISQSSTVIKEVPLSQAAQTAQAVPAAVQAIDPFQTFFLVCSVLWLAGLGAMLLYGLLSYGRLRRKLSVCIRLEDNIYLCDGIASPFILGLFRPKIYLPSGLEETARPYVLAHERAHLVHGDPWWKCIGFGLLSVYWFHPLVWIAYCLFCRDLEMACDERAVREMSPAERKSYACTLLACAASKSTFSACPVAFSQNSVKQRIANILQKKTTQIWVLALACVLAVGILWCFVTEPKNAEPESSPAGTIALDSATAPKTDTESVAAEDQAAYQFMQVYLDAAAQDDFDRYAEFVYFPNEAVYVLNKENYYPGVSSIVSWRRINSKLWAFDILYEGFEVPAHLFVGELDGEKKIIQHVDDVPRALRENLVASEFESGTFMHLSSDLQQIQYELQAFSAPAKVECFQLEDIQPNNAIGSQPSFTDLVFSTDVWVAQEDYSRAPGPRLYTTGCRITSEDGRSVVIRDDREGFDLFNADGTWDKQILAYCPGFSGAEILAYIRNWALAQEAG